MLGARPVGRRRQRAERELRLDDGAEHDEEVVGAVAERLALRAHPHGAGALRPRQRRAAERGGEVGTWPSPMR